ARKGKMKFGLIVPSEFKEHFLQHAGKEIPGLLGWVGAFGGKIYTINEDWSDRDVIMVNFSSTEFEYASIVRQVIPDVTIVCCLDYGANILSQYFTDLSRIKVVMDRCNYLYSVNKNQQLWMEILFPDRTIHYCPHPADVDGMTRYRRNPEERTMGIAAMWHQY